MGSTCVFTLTAWVAPKDRADFQLAVDDVESDNGVSAHECSPLDGVEPHAPCPHHGHAVEGRDLSPVEYRPEPGNDTAADKRGPVQGHIFGELYHAVFGELRVLEKARIETAEQHELLSLAGAVGAWSLKLEMPVLAIVRVSQNAVMAVAAPCPHDAADNVIAGPYVGDALPHFRNKAGHFMADEGRKLASSVFALDGMDVAVTDGCGGDPYFHFPLFDGVHFYFFYDQRLAVLVADCSFHFHTRLHSIFVHPRIPGSLRRPLGRLVHCRYSSRKSAIFLATNLISSAVGRKTTRK